MDSPLSFACHLPVICHKILGKFFCWLVGSKGAEKKNKKNKKILWRWLLRLFSPCGKGGGVNLFYLNCLNFSHQTFQLKDCKLC